MKRKLTIYDGPRVKCSRVCSLPFREMDIKPNGDVFCCNWTTTPFGNLQLNTAQEVWNSDNAKGIRQSVLNGRYEYCKGDECPYLSSPNEKQNPFLDKEPQLKLHTINAGYDRTCNLFCNSCRQFIIVDQNYQRQDILRARIEELGHVPELILIGGGDPFSSPHTRKWMEEGITLADTITIWSNGILLTRKRWNKLHPSTKKCIDSIEISIDAATEDTYHAVRAGGDWDILMTNMNFISELRASEEIHNLRLNFVVRLENYKEMPEFVDLGERFGADDIYFSRMEDWGSFSCNQVAAYQVHLNDHKLHNDFLQVLENPKLNNPKVRLGNLRGIQNASC